MRQQGVSAELSAVTLIAIVALFPACSSNDSGDPALDSTTNSAGPVGGTAGTSAAVGGTAASSTTASGTVGTGLASSTTTAGTVSGSVGTTVGATSGVGGAATGTATATLGTSTTLGTTGVDSVSANTSGIGGSSTATTNANTATTAGNTTSGVGGATSTSSDTAATTSTVTSTATTGSATTGGNTDDLLVPASGALLGAFVGTGTVAELESTLGRELAILHNFYDFDDNFTSRLAGDVADGYIPLITWETWLFGTTPPTPVPLDDILNGNYDSVIESRAQESANFGQPYFLRWGHEMNGNWYPWDGFHNGANAAATTKYIEVYRYIHDIFTNAGANNVIWVFCPNVGSVPGDDWNHWSNYYPGDAYVDWVAFDGYNWGTLNGQSWQEFSAMTGGIYSGLAATGKPIMIPETASTEQGGDKAAWIAGILPALQSSYPAIKAFVWFHMNKETDWRVDSSPGAASSFITFANDTYMNP